MKKGKIRSHVHINIKVDIVNSRSRGEVLMKQ